MKYFIFLFIIILAMFANGFTIFNNSTDDDEDKIVPEAFGNPFLDACVYVYFLALGELNTDNYGNQP